MATRPAQISILLTALLLPSCFGAHGTELKTPRRDNRVRPACPPEVDRCEFWLTLHHSVTMNCMKSGLPGDLLNVKYPIKIFPDGRTVIRDTLCSNDFLGDLPPGNASIGCTDFSNIPVGDGRYKDVYLFNNSLPGPPIVVYRGQQVIVHVTNNLINAATTIHWHGLHQHNTPWMDGVGDMSQCPILPGDTFTYRFLANQTGTYWYHAHLGTQRTMGEHGPLIILPNPQDVTPNPTYPTFTDEFMMTVSDWFIESSENLLDMIKYGTVSYIFGWDNTKDQCFLGSTRQVGGFESGVLPFQSALINGRGWAYDPETEQPVNHHVPLEDFYVRKGGFYKFRAISASMFTVLKISIDHHPLYVISSDGFDLRPKKVDHLIITPGERYDLYVDALDPLGAGVYWIRAETLEVYNHQLKTRKRHHTEAVLRYTTSKHAREMPTTTPAPCLSPQGCLVLNCPFRDYPRARNMRCVALGDLESLDSNPTPEPGPDSPFVEYMLNFHLARFRSGLKTVVNNILHVPPTAPVQIYPAAHQQYLTPCDESNCESPENLCICTHQLDIPLGATVQLVFLTSYVNSEGSLVGNDHQIHLHGHSFHVVKQGFPTYNSSTGLFMSMTRDITCDGTYCQRNTWRDSSWNDNGVPGIRMEGAPVKDTVVIPVGGYTVVRFKANNPGFWYMHCHTEFHNVQGMGLYLKVGNVSQMNAAPPGMATCGNFDWTSDEFESFLLSPRPPVEKSKFIEDLQLQLLIFQVLLSVAAAACFILMLTMAVLKCTKANPEDSGYRKLHATQDNFSRKPLLGSSSDTWNKPSIKSIK